MVVLDGTAYLVKSDGQIDILPDDTLVPFATVHFDKTDQVGVKVVDLAENDLGEKIFSTRSSQNVFFAVKITGQLKHVATRAVAAHTRPSRTRTQLAAKQAVSEADES